MDKYLIAKEYSAHGFALVATRAENNKEAYGQGWQTRGRDPEHWAANPDDGIGIIHALSGTCAIDIDDLPAAKIALEAIGVDLDALLSDPASVQIDSGREGRAKLLFRAQEYLPQKRHALNWPDKVDPTKRFAVIEFRAGNTHDVLPPSIHPDTGRPYKWVGNWRNLPLLPDSLAKIWREWALAKEAMEDACPWAPKRPARIPAGVRPKTYGGGHNDIIGRFNRAFTVGEILERNGYKRGGNRWLAPNSSTGIPGVVLLSDDEAGKELVYSHHASCPLNDGHAHDAFSVFCTLEHNGNIHAAVADAANTLGINREPDPEISKMVENLIQSKRQKTSGSVVALADYVPKKQEMEPEIINAPHPGPIPSVLLQQVYQYLCAQMHAVKPDALMQATLSFAAAMTARRYVTYDGQPATTFFCITDSSIAGLRRLKGKLSALVHDVGERQILRDRAPSSAGVFYNALIRSPRMYWITDEYGYLVRTAKRQTSGAMESSLSVLQLCYEGETIFVDPDVIGARAKGSNTDTCDIYAPSVTMLALLPNDHLNSLASHSEYGRGTLHQMITIPAGEAIDGHQPDSSATLPAGLVDHIKRLADMPGVPGTQNNANLMPAVKRVHWAPEVGQLVSAKLREWREYMSDDSRQQYRGLAHGYMQSAIRLGTSLAAWANPESPILTEEIANWAITWCERCLKLTMPRLEIINRADDTAPDIVQMIMEVLLEAKEPLTVRDISRRCYAFKKLSPEERDTIMTNLVDSGTVIARRTSQTTKYLPSRRT